MKVEFKGELRRVEKREYTKKDGTKGCSYPMLVECGADSFQFPAEEGVYDLFELGHLYKGAECKFVAEYNPRFQFNNFVVKEAEVV